MLFVCGYPLPAFEARTVLCNNSDLCEDRYSNLWKAIARSKVDQDGHNYTAGQNLKMKTEFYDYGQNALFICEKDGKYIFIMILKGSVYLKTDDIEDAELKMFLSKTSVNVYDSYGKKIKINNYDDLLSYIKALENSRNAFNLKLDKYHKFMENLQSYRREQGKAFNCFINEDFERLIVLCDDISKEFCDLLYQYHEANETKVIEDCFVKLNETERLNNVFGLYVAVLKAYILNYDGASMSGDERRYKNFLIEFSLFVSENENILDNYTKQYNLNKREREEIEQLLSEEGIYKEWNTRAAELTIL